MDALAPGDVTAQFALKNIMEGSGAAVKKLRKDQHHGSKVKLVQRECSELDIAKKSMMAMCPQGDVRLRLDHDAILAKARDGNADGNNGQVTNFSNTVGFGMLSGATTGIESFGTASIRYYAVESR